MTKPLREMTIAELNEQIWLHKEMVQHLERRSMRFKMALLKFEGSQAKKWQADETGHGRLFCELVIMGLDEEEHAIEAETTELSKVCALMETEAKRRGLA
jgi:hypothetical protein